MPTDIDPQEFGGMVANVKALLKNQETYREDQLVANNILFAKIDNLSLNGCARGQQHDKDVIELKLLCKKLDERPARIVGLGVLILTGLSILGGFFIWLHNRLGPIAVNISHKLGCG